MTNRSVERNSENPEAPIIPANDSEGTWDYNFKPMPTFVLCIILMTSNLFLLSLIFILPSICWRKKHCLIRPFSSLIYAHGLNWIIHLLGDQYWKYHHAKSKLDGYIDFYIRTKNIRRAPFYLVSLGNALLLIASTILYDYCKSYVCEEVDYLRGFMTIEVLAILSLITKYLMKLKEFHAMKAPPDVLRQDWMSRLISKRIPSIDTSELIGATPDRIRNIILERQSEVINLMILEIDELRLKTDQ